MKEKDKANVRELGDIAMLLTGQVIGHRLKAGEKSKVVFEEMYPYKERIEKLLTEMGL